jgi:hypothetical protein
VTDPQLDPPVFPEASVRADRLTPEVVGRRVQILTGSASLISTVTGYSIHVTSDVLSGWGRIPPVRMLTESSADIHLSGVNGTVTVAGNSEVRVLA